MKIDITVKGEPDVAPFTKTFQFAKSEEFIFFESLKVIKEKLAKNLILNINETLALYAGFVTISLNEEKTVSEIQEHILKLLMPHQVMIGVPESLQELVFSVLVNSDKQVFTVTTPFKLVSIFFARKSRYYNTR
jgi:urease gamma subunit